jgi:hypothetical protein
MSTVIIDLRRSSTTFEALQAWTGSGLLYPAAFARAGVNTEPETASDEAATDNTARGPFGWSWRLTGGAVDDRSRNELLNTLPDPIDVHVFTIVEPDAPSNWGQRRSDMHDLFNELEQDGYDLTRTLLIAPSQNKMDPSSMIPLDFVALATLADRVFVVSPEDSPMPTVGSEAGTRSLDGTVAHCTAALAGLWVTGGDSQPLQTPAGGGDARLIRTWTQVVDAGYVADHVARAIGEIDIDQDVEASKARLAAESAALLGGAATSADLIVEPVNAGDTPVPKGWAYVVAVLKYAWKHIWQTSPSGLGRWWLDSSTRWPSCWVRRRNRPSTTNQVPRSYLSSTSDATMDTERWPPMPTVKNSTFPPRPLLRCGGR